MLWYTCIQTMIYIDILKKIFLRESQSEQTLREAPYIVVRHDRTGAG